MAIIGFMVVGVVLCGWVRDAARKGTWRTGLPHIADH